MDDPDGSAAGAAEAFNSCINRRDLAGPAALMSADHIFHDSAGNAVSGKSACIEAWRGFFAAFPDYANHVRTGQVRGGTVIMSWRSSCSDARLAGPALWKAVIRDGLVAEWHVLDDTGANRAALGLEG